VHRALQTNEDLRYGPFALGKVAERPAGTAPIDLVRGQRREPILPYCGAYSAGLRACSAETELPLQVELIVTVQGLWLRLDAGYKRLQTDVVAKRPTGDAGTRPCHVGGATVG
jgi:hypothetical protein